MHPSTILLISLLLPFSVSAASIPSGADSMNTYQRRAVPEGMRSPATSSETFMSVADQKLDAAPPEPKAKAADDLESSHDSPRPVAEEAAFMNLADKKVDAAPPESKAKAAGDLETLDGSPGPVPEELLTSKGPLADKPGILERMKRAWKKGYVAFQSFIVEMRMKAARGDAKGRAVAQKWLDKWSDANEKAWQKKHEEISIKTKAFDDAQKSRERETRWNNLRAEAKLEVRLFNLRQANEARMDRFDAAQALDGTKFRASQQRKALQADAEYAQNREMVKQKAAKFGLPGPGSPGPGFPRPAQTAADRTSSTESGPSVSSDSA